MGSGKEAHQKALARWRERQERLTNPVQAKRREDYRDVGNPKGRACNQFRSSVRDMLAFGFRPGQLAKEIEFIIEEDSE
jgi:hypothetical protein